MRNFQPPPDYMRREVEAANAPSCPFYGASLMQMDRGMGRVGASVLMPGESNRCALVTSEHSPCWMEVEEHHAPEWAECPRNPEYLAANVVVGADSEHAREAAAERIGNKITLCRFTIREEIEVIEP